MTVLLEGLKRFALLLVSPGLFDFPPFSLLRSLVFHLCAAFGKNAVFESHIQLRCCHSTRGWLHAGDGAFIGCGSDLDCTGGITLGSGVWISEHTTIHTHSHELTEHRTDKGVHEIICEPLTLCDNCWIGSNSVILPSVHRIGIHAVVGAGSIVTKDVGDYEVVAGNPAVLLRRLDFSKDSQIDGTSKEQ